MASRIGVGGLELFSSCSLVELLIGFILRFWYQKGCLKLKQLRFGLGEIIGKNGKVLQNKLLFVIY